MEWVKNNMLWVVIAITTLNVCLFLGSKLIISKAADKVIEKLQKEYSPSPYGPGLDPDKVDPEVLRKQRFYFELRKKCTQNDFLSMAWRNEWEQDRGFSPEQ